MSWFDGIMANMDRLHAEGKLSQKVVPHKIQPQKRKTSKPVDFHGVEVRLLVTCKMPPTYTRAGVLKKKQPAPIKPGETVWAKDRFNGEVCLYPFQLAGSGYELVTDAVEGVHYEFI